MVLLARDRQGLGKVVPGCSLDKQIILLFIISSYEVSETRKCTRTAIKPRASRQTVLCQWIAMRNRVSQASPRCQASIDVCMIDDLNAIHSQQRHSSAVMIQLSNENPSIQVPKSCRLTCARWSHRVRFKFGDGDMGRYVWGRRQENALFPPCFGVGWSMQPDSLNFRKTNSRRGF